MSDPFVQEADVFGYAGMLAVKEHFEIEFPDALVEILKLPPGARHADVSVRKSVTDDGDLKITFGSTSYIVEAKRRRRVFRADGSIRYTTIFCGNEEHVARVKPWCTVIASEDLKWGAFIYAHMLSSCLVSARANRQPEGHKSVQRALEIPREIPEVKLLRKRK